MTETRLMLATLPRLRVRTLTPRALRIAAERLLTACLADGTPDMVIGIRSGGYTLAQIMQEFLPDVPLLAITSRRPGAEGKKRHGWLKRLPYAITNLLRLAEHAKLLFHTPVPPPALAPDANEAAALSEALARHASPYILLIDDAVDSGATLTAVMAYLNAAAPGARLCTAALTVTTPNPLRTPDIHLYSYVLCRFPWSLDYA